MSTLGERHQSTGQLSSEIFRQHNTWMDDGSADKPPPVIISNAGSIIMDHVDILLQRNKFTFKVLANSDVKIYPATLEVHQNIVKYLKDNRIEHHTYQQREERNFRALLRCVNYSLCEEEIKAELYKMGHIVRSMFNIRHRVTKQQLPIYFIDLEPRENNKDIFKIEIINNSIVQIEPPRERRELPQCKRCQLYGHTRTYCTRAFRCLRCGKGHPTSECEERETVPRCALCSCSHQANYQGCEIYQKLVRKKYKNKERMNNLYPRTLKYPDPPKSQLVPPDSDDITLPASPEPESVDALSMFQRTLDRLQNSLLQLSEQVDNLTQQVTQILKKLN